jgi:hypothetical protein
MQAAPMGSSRYRKIEEDSSRLIERRSAGQKRFNGEELGSIFKPRQNG